MHDISVQPAFPKWLVNYGYLLMLIGVNSLVILQLAVGLAFVLLGGVLSFTSYGIFVDVDNKQIKKYTSVYGLKFGKPVSYADKSYIELITGANGRIEIFLSTKPLYTDVLLVKVKKRATAIKVAGILHMLISAQILDYCHPEC